MSSGSLRFAALWVFVAACGGSTFDSASTTSGTGSGGDSSGSGGSNGTGGSTNTGGSTGSAGSNGTGGSTGAAGGAGNSGGSSGSGGHLGSGGMPQTGGSMNTGGMPQTGGSMNTGGMTQTGGMTGSGGGVGSGGSVSSDGGISCTDLLNKSNILLGEAQVCTGNVATECASTIAGWCGCPVLVSSPSSYITVEYQNALASYNSQCPHACPGFCLFITTGVCGAPVDGGLRKCVRSG
jgi:hypothetical protein